MDKTTEAIASHATALRYEDLTPEAIHSTKRSFIDALGCGIGGSTGPTSMIAKKIAGLSSSPTPARILGTTDYSSPDMAAFANTVMVHYLNMDEGWRELPQSGGFPGRIIPAIMAVAEPQGAGGQALITATVAAYDVCGRFVSQLDLHTGHWNQSFYTAMGSIAGLANLMRLNHDQAANAVSLAAINSLRMRQTRNSNMPLWKAADCADANRGVVLYAYLSREGMTGPGEPFEGEWGLWRQAGAEDPEKRGMEPFTYTNESFKITQMSHKIYPCHHHGIAAISMAIGLRDKVKAEDIKAINVQAYHRALFNVGGGPDKPQRRDPRTREDADHSLPWLISVALRDGNVTPASFEPVSLLDPALRPVMATVNVTENLEFTRRYPNEHAMTMEIVTRSGQRYTAASKHAKGDRANALTDKELEAKFIGLAEEILGARKCREALDVLWNLDDLESVGPIFESLTARSTGRLGREVA
jgi:2-methylcitrate dehydratase